MSQTTADKIDPHVKKYMAWLKAGCPDMNLFERSAPDLHAAPAPAREPYNFTYSRPVKVLPKSQDENVFVALQDRDGDRVIDVRTFLLIEETGPIPTEEGIYFSVQHGKAFAQAILDAVETAHVEQMAASPVPAPAPAPRGRRF